jgi:MFS family permease
MGSRVVRQRAAGKPAHPRWWPQRWFYGWAIVGALSITELASYGVLSSAFTVFLAPMSAELGWSRTQLTGAFSLAALVAGGTAIPVGRWVDRHGARGLMTTGAALATGLLVAWSRVGSLGAYYALSALMGVAMAAVFYEPAFAVVATWFRTNRGRALTVLTVVGGFAGAVFVPLAAWLVEVQGWRGALLSLAALYAALSIGPCAVILRRRPGDLGLEPDGGVAAPGLFSAGRRENAEAPSEHSRTVRQAVVSRSFWWLALAFAGSTFATAAVSVHLVPLLIERGYRGTWAATVTGLLSLAAMLGRPVLLPLGDRWPRASVATLVFGLQAVALAVLLTIRQHGGVWAFVVLFGMGLGAITPTRAALVADYYGHEHYGKISGVLALLISLTRAAAPLGASLLYASATQRDPPTRSGYEPVLLTLAILCTMSSAAVFAAGRAAPPGGAAAQRGSRRSTEGSE